MKFLSKLIVLGPILAFSLYATKSVLALFVRFLFPFFVYLVYEKHRDRENLIALDKGKPICSEDDHPWMLRDTSTPSSNRGSNSSLLYGNCDGFMLL